MCVLVLRHYRALGSELRTAPAGLLTIFHYSSHDSRVSFFLYPGVCLFGLVWNVMRKVGRKKLSWGVQGFFSLFLFFGYQLREPPPRYCAARMALRELDFFFPSVRYCVCML